jgi:hypothetical protein
MNDKILEMKFYFKSMGISGYFPIIVSLLLMCISSFLKEYPEKVIVMLEFFLPVLSSWWIVHTYGELLRAEGKEIILSYPIKRSNLGNSNVFIFFFIYLLLLFFSTTLINIIVFKTFFSSLFIMYSVQSFFFVGLGFFCITILKDTGWALTVIATYSCTQILTKGELFPLINVYSFNQELLQFTDVTTFILTPFFLGLFLWSVASLIFNDFL